MMLNQTISRGKPTEQPLELCPGFPNARFPISDNPLPYFVNAALNVPLAVVTTFANLVVLLAMRRVKSIRLPSKLLLCSLVLTDLGAGSIAQPQYAAFLFVKAIHPDRVQCILVKSALVTGSLFSCVSLLTLTTISLDRYAALFFHINYQQIVTIRRVCAVLAFIWMLTLFLTSTIIWMTEWYSYAVYTVTAINVPIISFAYIKIFRRLRVQHLHPQAPDQGQQPAAGNTLNMKRYRRTASAMMWVYVLFLICYVPFSCLTLAVEIVNFSGAFSVSLWNNSCTLILLNSLLNPFLYCFRLPEIRAEVTKHLKKLCRC